MLVFSTPENRPDLEIKKSLYNFEGNSRLTKNIHK